MPLYSIPFTPASCKFITLFFAFVSREASTYIWIITYIWSCSMYALDPNHFLPHSRNQSNYYQFTGMKLLLSMFCLFIVFFFSFFFLLSIVCLFRTKQIWLFNYRNVLIFSNRSPANEWMKYIAKFRIKYEI